MASSSLSSSHAVEMESNSKLRKSNRKNKIFTMDFFKARKIEYTSSFLNEIFNQAFNYSKKQSTLSSDKLPSKSTRLSIGIDFVGVCSDDINARLAYVYSKPNGGDMEQQQPNASLNATGSSSHSTKSSTKPNVEIVDDHIGCLKYLSEYKEHDVLFIEQFKYLIRMAFKCFGRKFYELNLLDEAKWLKTMPFQVVNKLEIPYFKFNDERSFNCEYIIGKFVEYLLKTLDIQLVDLNDELVDLCVSVPTDFYTFQRISLRNCLESIGIKKYKIINKSSALTVPFLLKDRRKTASKILVVDFPSGHMNCSLLESKSKAQMNIVAQFADKDISTKQFMDNLYASFVEETRRKGVALNSLQLRSAFDSAQLDKANEVWTFQLNNNNDNNNNKKTEVKLNLRSFQIHKLIDQMIAKLKEKQLIDSTTGKLSEDITNVLICCDLIVYEYFEQAIKSYSTNKNKILFIDNDCAALGASLYISPLIDIKFKELLPYSLKMGLYNGVVKQLIASGTQYPCKGTHSFQTIVHNQKTIRINLYEGEAHLARNCVHICEVILENLADSEAGINRYKLKVDFDESGQFRVRVFDVTGGSRHKLSHRLDYIPMSSVYFEREISLDGGGANLTFDAELAAYLEELDVFLETIQKNREYNSVDDVRKFLWNKIVEAKNFMSKNRFKIKMDECRQIREEMEEFTSQVNLEIKL